MKPLYRLFVWVFRLFNHLYFLEVATTEREKVPSKGPVMFAANHPSSILDALLLATHTDRQIHYLARSGLFRFPIAAGLFKHLGAIPVYRQEENPNSASLNVGAFRKVYELFGRGGCVGIFPEGKNSPRDQVRELRKGAARIALGAEARYRYELGLTIVPVGLTFENRDFFMTKVLLRFGTPILISDYADLHQQDPDAAIDALTADMQTALRRQTVHIEDRRLGDLADDLLELMGVELDQQFPAPESAEAERKLPFFKRWFWSLLGWYRRSTPQSGKALEHRMQSRQQIMETLAYAERKRPRHLAALSKQVERYQDHMQQTRLKGRLKQDLHEPVRERLLRLRMTIYALAMAPVALFGFVHNAIPYLIARGLGRLSRDEAVRTFAYFGFGFLLFVGTYTFYGMHLWREVGLSPEWVFAYLATLPPTGFAALRYRRNVLLYRDKILVRTFFWNRRELVELLRYERRLILDRFQHLTDPK